MQAETCLIADALYGMHTSFTGNQFEFCRGNSRRSKLSGIWGLWIDSWYVHGGCKRIFAGVHVKVSIHKCIDFSCDWYNYVSSIYQFDCVFCVDSKDSDFQMEDGGKSLRPPVIYRWKIVKSHREQSFSTGWWEKGTKNSKLPMEDGRKPHRKVVFNWTMVENHLEQ